MKKAILVVTVSVLLILMLFLGACTKATSTTTTTPKPTTSQPATSQPPTSTQIATTKPTTTTAITTTAAPTPTVNKYGGKLTFIWNDTSPLMGFPTTNSQPGQFYGGMCIETLIQGTLTPYVYDPKLALSWELAADKSAYTFKLRQGVKFSDSTEMKAKDVKFAIDRAIAT